MSSSDQKFPYSDSDGLSEMIALRSVFECVPPLQRHTRLDILNNCDGRHRFGLGRGMGCHALYAMVDHETCLRVMDVEETSSDVVKWIWGALFECVPASGSS